MFHKAYLLLFFIVLIGCTTNRAFDPSKQSDPPDELNIVVSGKLKYSSPDDGFTASFELELNADEAIMTFFDPFGSAVASVHADPDNLSGIDYREKNVEVYPNTIQNRERLFRFDLNNLELMEFLKGGEPSSDQGSSDFVIKVPVRKEKNLPSVLLISSESKGVSIRCSISKIRFIDREPILLPDLPEDFIYTDHPWEI